MPPETNLPIQTRTFYERIDRMSPTSSLGKDNEYVMAPVTNEPMNNFEKQGLPSLSK